MATDMDSGLFRQTVGHFVTGVTVVAIEVDGAVRAMTANAFASLSLDPPLVLFCVGKAAHLGLLIHAASGFSVSILALEQRPLSTYFAGAWRDPEPPPFSFVTWEGGPRLEGCLAALGCTVESIHPGGDHWIVVGRVLTLFRADREMSPLLFCSGHYGTLTKSQS
jgi:3-hydroxy-9,10-secoandrosta-1,3,5(10)-triene-9,17-dione monooxygenase reductase component